MTDARFPERWLSDRRLLHLPDAEFRLFVMALAWSVANRTDGVLCDDDLPLIPGADPAPCRRLAEAGLWERAADYWVITEFEDTQSTRADLMILENARRRQREKKRRQRAAAAAKAVPGYVPGDSTRTGQARTGSPKTEGQGPTPAGESATADEAGGFTPSQFSSPENHDGPEQPSTDDQQHPATRMQDAKVTTVTREDEPGPPAAGNGQVISDEQPAADRAALGSISAAAWPPKARPADDSAVASELVFRAAKCQEQCHKTP